MCGECDYLFCLIRETRLSFVGKDTDFEVINGLLLLLKFCLKDMETALSVTGMADAECVIIGYVFSIIIGLVEVRSSRMLTPRTSLPPYTPLLGVMLVGLW